MSNNKTTSSDSNNSQTDKNQSISDPIPFTSETKEALARAKAFEQDKKQYRLVDSLIHQFFHEVVFTRENYCDSGERRAAIAKMICKKSVLDSLFHEFLKLLGTEKIKNVGTDYTAKDIFNANMNQIVDGVCAEPNVKNLSFYQYNLYSFYIVQSAMLNAMNRMGVNYPALGLFFEESYSGIAFLLTLYGKCCAVKKHGGNSIADGALTKTTTRHESQLFNLIGHTLYDGTPLDNGHAAPSETAMLCIRHYVEVWLRLTFNAWYIKKGQFIKVSTIFEVIKNNMTLIKNDLLMKDLPDFENIITTLSKIYKCANYYTHSPRRQLFWVPNIIYMYLQEIYHKYIIFYEKITRHWNIHPKLVPNECGCWQKLYDEIHKL